MELTDLKNIFYFIVAILWFVFSTYNKNRKANKQEVPLPKKTKPNIFEEVVKEFKKGFEDQTETVTSKSEKIKKVSPKDLKKEIPEEVIAAEKRKQQRETTLKNSINEKNEKPEIKGALLGECCYEYNELQKMVIFTEIFKRPNF